MNRKISFGLLLAAVAVLSVSADNIRWLATEYNFGSFKEAAGPQTGFVQFVNEGSEPTLIQRVKSTCGCTIARYTEDIVMPGDTATVWMEYNPTGRPGRFEKHVKVYTGDQSDVTTIRISGTVIGAPATLHASYPLEFGSLRLGTTQMKLGTVTYGQSRHEYIYGYNQGTDTLHIAWKPVPRAVSMAVSSKAVAPGDLFTLSAYFNTRDQADTGSIELPVTLLVTENDNTREVPIVLTANVLPDTSKYTEQQLRDAPLIMVYPTSVELGTPQKPGKPAEVSFNIKNDGKTPLHISRIHTPGTSGLLTVKSMPGTLKPGKTGTVKGLVDTSALDPGPVAIEVEIVSDDPLHPVTKARIVGVISAHVEKE